ncbi:MAG: ribonuclease P protein subunit [Candidatus Norongarragalinales archaeon]
MKTDASALSRKRWASLSPSAAEFLAGELIGEKARVEWSSDKGFQGLEGKITDETKNTFVLETGKGRKTVPKNGCVFFFLGAGVKADGELLVSRPEDRTKKIARLSARR